MIATINAGIAIHDGYTCTICDYSGKTVKTFSCHSAETNHSPRAAKIQTLQKGNKIQYFAVRPENAFLPSKFQPRTDLTDEIHSFFKNNCMDSTPHIRQNEHFLVHEWSHIWSTTERQSLRTQMHDVVDPTTTKTFRSVCGEYVKLVNDSIVKGVIQLRKMICVADARGFHSLDCEESIEKYAGTLLILVKFALLAVRENFQYCENWKIQSQTYEENPSICNLKDLIEAIFGAEYHLGIDAAEIPIRKFVVLVASRSDGTFHPASTVTSCLAAIKFAVRGAVLLNLLEQDTNEKDEELLSILSLDRLNPFNIMTSESTLLTYIAGAEELPDSIYWEDISHYRKLNVNGKMVSLEDLAHCYTRLKDRLSHLLNNKILLGLESTPFTDIYDNFKERMPGWSFVDEKRNNIDKSCLVHFLSQNKDFVIGSEWNRIKIKEWCAQVEDFMKCMLVAVHLCSGMPARATELETYQSSNLHTSLRSVYVYSNRIMLIQVSSF